MQNVPTQIVPEGAIQQTIDRPQMYYGEDLPGYAITNTERAEIDFNIGGQEEAQKQRGQQGRAAAVEPGGQGGEGGGQAGRQV